MANSARADFFGGGRGSAGPLFEERDKGQRTGDKSAPARLPMTEDERRVAAVLEQARGRDNSIPRKRIEELLGIDERAVKAAVEGLRKTHGWLIGALRQQGGGYFLCVDAQDMIVAMKPYFAQAVDMIRYVRSRVPESVWLELEGQLRLVLEGAAEER